jgi:hypothetical protein
MSIELRVAAGSRPTGRLLAGVLGELGVRVVEGHGLHARGDAIVSYGVRVTGETRPTLNANAGSFNKFQELERLRAGHVPSLLASIHPTDFEHPWFARKFQHHGGRDLQVVFTQQEADWRRQAGWDFFTRYVRSDREFRVWVYRRRAVGAYEKVMRRPREFTRIGRNYDNGFVFEHLNVTDLPSVAPTENPSFVACAAVQALGLDFGAVDMLYHNLTGISTVLEVNTAPGTEAETRQGLRGLAEKIQRWEAAGYPRRNGDDTQPRRLRPSTTSTARNRR